MRSALFWLVAIFVVVPAVFCCFGPTLVHELADAVDPPELEARR